MITFTVRRGRADVVDPSDTETGLSEDAAGPSFAGTCHAPDFGELH